MRKKTKEPRKTILFAGHDFKFLKPIIAYYQAHPGFNVLMDEHKGHVITDTAKSQRLLKKSDVIFCEWCLGNTEWYSNNKKAHQILITRLHAQEIIANLPYLTNTNWKNVDNIIFICPRNMDLFLNRFPVMKGRAVLIYNPIDCDALCSQKLYGAEFNLGMMVLAPKQKSPDLAFEILKRLKNIDGRYTLFIKGKKPWEYDWLWRQPEQREYYRNFYSDVNSSKYSNSVVFDPHGNNVPDWLSKIGFILSTSEHEGSHQAVAEGMASGAIPVIRNWPGADLLYPKQFVFKTVDEAVELILKSNRRENYSDQCEFVKQYARERFDQNIVIQQYDHCIVTLLNKKGHLGPQKAMPGVQPKSKSIVAMHVCYLNPENQSGYEIRVLEETKLLRTLGIRVIIACFVKRDHAYPNKAKSLWRLHRRLKQSTGAKIYVIPTNHYFDLNVPSEGIKMIARPLIALAKRHKVNIMHGQALYSTMHVLRANKRVGAKVVFDVHGAAPEETEMSGGHVERVKRLEKWEQEALRIADLRVFVSNRMHDFFKDKYRLPDLPHVVLPCCVHNDKFQMAEDIRLSKRNILGIQDKFVFLYLGTLSVWQWPEAMFSLFAQFYQKRPDSLFYLLLPTSDHEKALSFLKKHNLPATSFIVDEVPHNEVGSVIGIADVGLLLRKPHPVNLVSCPTKFGEYLAAGVPVISTPGIGDISDFYKTRHLGLVISPNDNGLKLSDLRRLLDFAQEFQDNRQIIAGRCIKASKELLAWSAHVKLLAKAYEGLIPDKQPTVQDILTEKAICEPATSTESSRSAPIFVCGTGRSGTSILQLVLSKHANIFSLRYEGRFLTSVGGLMSVLSQNNDRETIPVFKEKILGEWYKKTHRKGTSQEYVGGLCANIQNRDDIRPLLGHLEESLNFAADRKARIQAIRQFVCRFYEQAMRETGKPRWLEKTPTNILYMEELLEIFPEAKIIHICRDGRDVAASIIANDFWPIWKNDVLDISHYVTVKSPQNCAIYWRELLHHAFQKARFLPKGSYMQLNLEDLVADPRNQLQQICRFLGEQFDEAMLSINLSKHNIGRWRDIFTQSDVRDFKKEAGELLIELGYETDNSW